MTPQADKLRMWLESGGTLRLVERDERHAVVDLRTCTGELMERCVVDDPATLDGLAAEDLSG